tara:strand:+ start:401 stop:862 length:462 start_codon:yes stop_codon:yes gene_type:complete
MFAKITNGQVTKYPYTVGDLRRENSNTSFPRKMPAATMVAFGMYPVGYEAAPKYDPLTHRLQHSDIPELIDGEWTLTKTVVALTAGQIQNQRDRTAASNRADRDGLLSQSDWTQVADAPVSALTWATYRQALRDITSHANWPNLNNADWPTKP